VVHTHDLFEPAIEFGSEACIAFWKHGLSQLRIDGITQLENRFQNRVHKSSMTIMAGSFAIRQSKTLYAFI